MSQPSVPTSPAQPALQVACLCAAWCGTCGSYSQTFAQIAQEFPQCQFRWIDIEDCADAMDDFDVENFPTILLTRDSSVRFLGTLTPHPDTLRRLVQKHLENAGETGSTDTNAYELAKRLELI